MAFLGLGHREQCPFFDFQPCEWRTIRQVQYGSSAFEHNGQGVHSGFDRHSQDFSPGLHRLLAANRMMEEVGLAFLSLPDAATRVDTELRQRILLPARALKRTAASTGYKFDVALSFSSTERHLAEELANRIREAGYSVFYDNFYKEDLWGKDLVALFDAVYRKESRYCVLFVSASYAEGMWTNHERQSAQARALLERGNTYILPIKVEEAELPGFPPTIGYLPISDGVDRIADVLIKKLRSK